MNRVCRVYHVDEEKGSVTLVHTLMPDAKHGKSPGVLFYEGGPLVTGSTDGTINVWDATTGALRKTFRAKNTVTGCNEITDLHVVNGGANQILIAVHGDTRGNLKKGQFVIMHTGDFHHVTACNIVTGRKLYELQSYQNHVRVVGNTLYLVNSGMRLWMAPGLNIQAFDVVTGKETFHVSDRPIRRESKALSEVEIRFYDALPGGIVYFQCGHAIQDEPGEDEDAPAWPDDIQEVWEVWNHGKLVNRIRKFIDVNLPEEWLIAASASCLAHVSNKKGDKMKIYDFKS